MPVAVEGDGGAMPFDILFEHQQVSVRILPVLSTPVQE